MKIQVEIKDLEKIKDRVRLVEAFLDGLAYEDERDKIIKYSREISGIDYDISAVIMHGEDEVLKKEKDNKKFKKRKLK